MSLILQDHEAMLVDAARGLFDRAAPVSTFRARRDAGTAGNHDRALLSELAKSGFVAPDLSEDASRYNLSVVAAGLVAEQSGRTLSVAPLTSAAMAATLLSAAEGDQPAALLAALSSGERIIAVAVDERSRHDPDLLETRAILSADGWFLDGSKTAVIDGCGADDYLISASIDGAPAIFHVEAGAAGMQVEHIATLDYRNHARLALSGVPANLLIGSDASPAIGKALNVGRALLAAELLGVADEAFSRTIGYLKERKQFDRIIGTFQALQHRSARLYARLELARGVMLKALRALDQDDPQASSLASLAKYMMTKLARETLTEAMQMHGGIGVTDEFDLGFFVKRGRVAGDLLGDDLFHLDRLARSWGL